MQTRVPNINAPLAKRAEIKKIKVIRAQTECYKKSAIPSMLKMPKECQGEKKRNI